MLGRRTSAAEAKYETALERLTASLEGFRKDQEKMRGDLTSAQERLRTDMENRLSSSLRRTFALVLGAMTLVITVVAEFNLYGG